ncbi:MAG: mycofactocin-coupled SDR family oxidoreductase [Acidobacteriota bacterium]|nr:mycofactocin-coupled SDR family oxidoreductase [Acidobacteriota bacterium]
MTGRLEGKVTFITGAGRGQGRAHAVKQGSEGAKVIAIDICENIESNPYPLSSWDDLQETKALVEKAGSQCLTVKADVRSRDQLADAMEQGVKEFGRLTTVCANAGILPMAMGDPNPTDFQDAVDVDLLGVMNAVRVAIPHILSAGREGSIIITGSTAGMMPNTLSPARDPKNMMGPGSAGYGWAKRILISYTEEMALHLSPYGVRVNCIHPTNVNTHLIHNDGIYAMFRPDLEVVTREDFIPSSEYFQALPIPWLEPEEVADLVCFLASDESKNITGDNIRIDAGSYIKWPNGPA